MVTIVWLVLSLFGVCSFTWLPIFIDTFLSAIFVACKSDKNNETVRYLSAIVLLGVSCFAFYKFFFGLTISTWWIILSPIMIFLLIVVPGGFTIINLLFENHGLIDLPVWGLVVGIVVDVLLLVVFIFAIISDKINKE